MAGSSLLGGARALKTRLLAQRKPLADAPSQEDEVEAPFVSALPFRSSLAVPKTIERPLSIEDDDYAGDPSTTGVVNPGGTNFGVFETAGDSDWFSITLQEGQTLIVKTNANPTRPLIAFYDANGALIEPELARQDGSFAWVYIMRAPASGTFFVATSPNAFPGSVGYNFSAQVYPADDFAANVSTAGSLDSGSASGTFEHVYDVDWFAVTLEAGQSIDITGPSWLTQILFYDAAGNPVEVDFFGAFNSSNTLQTVGFTATTGGTYYVSVAGIGTGAQYTLTAQNRDTPHPNDVDTFAPVTTSGALQGVLGASGEQWFSVHLEAGQSIYLDELDTAVYSAYGESLQVHHASDETQRLFTVFTASETGAYYFRASGAPGSAYLHETLIYTDDAPDSLPPLNGGEAFPVLASSGQVVNGQIEIFGDRDVYAFNLSAGETVQIRLEFTDPHLLSEGLIVSVWNGFSWDEYHGQYESSGFSEIVFTAPSTGTFYVSFDGLHRYRGDYTLTLTPATPADAYDGNPSIIPSMPARPTEANVTETIVYSTTGTHTVDAGAVLYGVNIGSVIQASNPPFASPTLNNAGLIYGYSDDLGFTAVSAAHLINSGTIVGESNTPFPDVLNAGSVTGLTVTGIVNTDQPALENGGEIIARAVGANARGVSSSSDPLLHNDGLIVASASWGQRNPALAGAATGISLGNGGTVINGASGQILAEGDGYAAGINVSQWALHLTNHGLIEANARGAHGVARGVDASAASFTSADIHNYGIIRADQALYGDIDLVNHAGGLIEGDIILTEIPDATDFDAVQTITNQGTIIGHVDMGDGADAFDNTGGLVVGSVDLSYGADTFIGGANADAVVGGHGDDTLFGNGGNDLLLGSYGDDMIVGGAGNDGLYGEIGDDTIVTAGGDVVSGGVGNDRIETGDYTFASITGDDGFDTWVLPAGTRTLNLSLVAASGRVSGIEALALAGNQTVVVSQSDVASISNGNALYISGAATDAVYLTGAWSSAGQNVLDGVTYAAYSAGGESIFVQVGIAVAIGASPPAGTGLDAIAGGTPASAPGSVDGADLSPAIIDSHLRIIGDLVIGRDEVWQNQYGATVLGAENLLGTTLVNHGVLSSIGSTNPHVMSPVGPGFFGSATTLSLAHIESVVNHGVVVATAILDGRATAYFGGAAQGFVNEATGVIHAYAENGLAIAIDGFESSPGVWGSWAFTNRGDVYAFSNTGFAIALSEHNGSYILNDGVIEADGGDGAIAVDLSNGGEGVWNRGEIIAYAPPTSTYFSYGIMSYNSTQIVNEGLIAAEIAIDIFDRYGGNVSIDNSGLILGAIIRTHATDSAFGDLSLTNSGDIFGPILFTTGVNTNTIVNSGYIEGDILLAGGDDVYDGRTGQFFGELHAGAGADWLRGGAQSDVFYGESGADVLEGGGGADTLDGGAGADQLFGGDGNDTIFYDPADIAANVQGGAGLDTLVFTSGSAPTSFNLAAQGFERAEGRLSDTGGADWSTRTLVYDSQWRLDTETTLFDNGSRAFHDYDQTSQFAWSDEWTLFDALDRVDVIVTTFDDGTYSNNNHDQDDSFVWSSEWTRYTAADEVDTIVTTFDDGARSINEFDVGGAQPWITQWTHYDTLDRADIVVTTFDDGSYSINELDVANVESWATQWTRYDALDRVDTVVTTYEDGSYAILDLDQEDAFDWASQWWLYNSSGQVVQYELVPDGAGIADQPALAPHTAAPLAITHWPTPELLSASSLAGAGFSWRGDWAYVGHDEARSASFDTDAFVLAGGPLARGPDTRGHSSLWDAMFAAHANARADADAAPATLPTPPLFTDHAPFVLEPFDRSPDLDHLIMAA